MTLYGIVDDGFNWTSNSGGHNLYNLSSGVMQASRWGLRGREELGGGLAALFRHRLHRRGGRCGDQQPHAVHK